MWDKFVLASYWLARKVFPAHTECMKRILKNRDLLFFETWCIDIVFSFCCMQIWWFFFEFLYWIVDLLFKFICCLSFFHFLFYCWNLYFYSSSLVEGSLSSSRRKKMEMGNVSPCVDAKKKFYSQSSSWNGWVMFSCYRLILLPQCR